MKKKPSDLIATPDRWCKNAFGIGNKNGKVTYLGASDDLESACSLCLDGALRVAASSSEEYDQMAATLREELATLWPSLDGEWEDEAEPLWIFNDKDQTKHSDVLALLQKVGL